MKNFTQLELDNFLAAEGVSFLIPTCSTLNLVELVLQVAEYVRTQDNIVVSFDTWHREFPNTRGNIAYHLEEDAFHITFAGHPTPENALRYLFFLAHGAGHHYTQTNSGFEGDPEFAASVLRASRLMTPTGRNLTEPDPDYPELYFGSLLSGYELSASFYGWCIIEDKLWGEHSSQAQPFRPLYWLYCLVDHIWHRRCIADAHLPNDRRWWLAGEGFCLDSLLAPWLIVEGHYHDHMHTPYLEMVEGWELILAGPDGRLHKPDKNIVKALALAVEYMAQPLGTY